MGTGHGEYKYWTWSTGHGSTHAQCMPPHAPTWATVAKSTVLPTSNGTTTSSQMMILLCSQGGRAAGACKRGRGTGWIKGWIKKFAPHSSSVRQPWVFMTMGEGSEMFLFRRPEGLASMMRTGVAKQLLRGPCLSQVIELNLQLLVGSWACLRAHPRA